MNSRVVSKLLRATEVVLPPRRALSAYGSTHINYHLVSPVEDMGDKTRLREGLVVSERPLILTPEILKERFEGFGEEGAEFARWLSREYQDVLRALEYKFRNKDFHTRVLSETPRIVTGRIKSDIESRSAKDTVLISCPDAGWSLALMKFTLDEAARAFPGHVRSYEEHGLFDPAAAALRGRKAEIESLFQRAESDPESRSVLGKKLKEYGLFSEFEDRYLALYR